MFVKAQTCEFPLINKVGKTLRIKSINRGVLEIVCVILVFVQRLCIADDGVFDAGQARYVKPHIDLKLKLHKMLNNAGHARTEDD